MSKLPVPISYQNQACQCGKYLYAVGGYHSTDTGCPAWGTSDPSDIRFIGDHLGDLVITYADGSSDTVPLILGYTLWPIPEGNAGSYGDFERQSLYRFYRGMR